MELFTASMPSMCTSPDVGARKPVSMRSVVVLPAPLGPRKPTISPVSTRNDTSFTASLLPYRLVRA